MKRKIKIETKEFKIKLIISVSLLLLLVLSFFFAKDIESLLGWDGEGSAHYTSSEALASSNFYVEYLDVGQGSCTFVSLPDGTTLLIDSGSANYGKQVETYLKNRGIEMLDYVIATHADADHIGAFSYLFQKFEVRHVLRPFQIAGTGTSSSDFVTYEDEDLAAVYDLIRERDGEDNRVSRVTTLTYKNFISGIYRETYEEDDEIKPCEVSTFYDGLKISGANYEIEFFAPFVREDEILLSDYSSTLGYATTGRGVDDSNGNSAIFLLSVEGNTFLFTGDAPFGDSNGSGNGFEEYDFVKSLTSAEAEKLSGVSVYLAGHHGSRYSSGETLLSLIRPQFVVISVAEDNNYGHPNNETVTRLQKYKDKDDAILQTSELGSVRFGVVGGTLKFTCAYLEKLGSYKISWILVSCLAFLFVEIVIISIRPKTGKSQNC